MNTSFKNQKLHMIGNAHIDPVWLWQWPEGFHEVKATFRSALDRMGESDDFLFVSSSAAYYEWVEQSDPAMFAEIQQRVAEGRWEIVGGWWVQPDCNLPGGESFVRQGLYGQRYFKAKFGVMAKVGYNVDSFGHHGMLPQILRKSRMDSYVFMRPSPHEKALPERLFWWESDDGSRVLTFRIPFEYCTSGKELDLHIRRVANELHSPFDQMMCFYGVGNHGGGPTKENIESIKALNHAGELPELAFSTPNTFFKDVRSQNWPIPVHHGDLQHHASGCYAAHSGVKRWNRQAENALIAAEKFSALAMHLVKRSYPDRFAEAWKDVLFNQFHDIMAGTSLESAYEDARNQYGEALAIAGRALNLAVQTIAWQINIPPEPDMKPLIVFNPHPWLSRVSVEIESARIPDNYILLDEQDRLVPFQLIQSEATTRGRFRLTFVAHLPAMGYRTYRLLPGADQPPAATVTQASVPTASTSDYVLENKRFRLEFDTADGTIRRLYDKLARTDVFSGPAALPLIIDDPSDTWSHGVYAFNKVLAPMTLKSIRVIASGPVQTTMRVVSTFGTSTLMQDFVLYEDLNVIDVHVMVDWHEHFKMLKLRFPTNLHFMKVTREIPYGSIECFANGEELPMQSWVDVSGSSRDTNEMYGVSILNDGKSSCDINMRDIGLTVLRSPIYAHHEPMIPDPNGEYSFIDQGIQHFTYAIQPHLGSWEQAGTVNRAAELNQRPIALFGTYHPGSLPQSADYVSATPFNLMLSVLKKAEDNDDLIVRCYETAKCATHGTIRVFDQQIEADFGPCEIKTFRIPKGGPIRETDVLEQ